MQAHHELLHLCSNLPVACYISGPHFAYGAPDGSAKIPTYRWSPSINTAVTGAAGAPAAGDTTYYAVEVPQPYARISGTRWAYSTDPRRTSAIFGSLSLMARDFMMRYSRELLDAPVIIAAAGATPVVLDPSATGGERQREPTALRFDNRGLCMHPSHQSTQSSKHTDTRATHLILTTALLLSADCAESDFPCTYAWRVFCKNAAGDYDRIVTRDATSGSSSFTAGWGANFDVDMGSAAERRW